MTKHLKVGVFYPVFNLFTDGRKRYFNHSVYVVTKLETYYFKGIETKFIPFNCGILSGILLG